MEDIQKQFDALYRSNFGRLVAILTSIFGFDNLETAEDLVQDAFIKALHSWNNKIPEHPEGWLLTVARNNAINEIKHKQRLKEKLSSGFIKDDAVLINQIDNLFLASEIEDSQLRMLFACCHPKLPVKSQIILILKVIAGFKVNEIARGLMMTEFAVNKTLSRTKLLIKEENINLSVPFIFQSKKRLNTVLNVLYLIYNEGYNASSGDLLIKKEVCAEAIRLVQLLVRHPLLANGKTFALLALFLFNSSRFNARLDQNGNIVPLKGQDRKQWNYELIKLGQYYLKRSKNNFSKFHLEAAIAFEYAISKSFEDISWNRILSYYDTLLSMQYSPLLHLNKAIVKAEISGAEEALNEIGMIKSIEELKNNYLFYTTLGTFYERLHQYNRALEYYSSARKLTVIPCEINFLSEKIKAITERSNCS